ncbi:hypothetical protein E1A91_A09G148700v1 [Gossypium mustelinum]|uniref:Uncharacterized protein n=1 Tax=Gossypium mustelinum TaxID=34275 RepID=A0A5D2Y0Z2_GOSMU|nr:hypothetical protein E1A91_A09G148700v1 [Gossypium mustelinum]
MAFFNCFSLPKFKARLSFHTSGKAVIALSADNLEAKSKALANFDMGKESSRHLGSNPKENLHMPVFDLTVDDLKSERFNGVFPKLQACHLLLKPPGIAVHIEYASTKKVTQYQGERFPFWEILKSGFEHVLHVVRVGCDCIAQNMDMDGVPWRVL